MLTLHDVFHEAAEKCDAAQARYGPIASTHEALGVALEEWDELRAAVHQNALGSVEMEALDLAAICLRLAMACRQRDARFMLRSGM